MPGAFQESKNRQIHRSMSREALFLVMTVALITVAAIFYTHF
nr:MAG TPA: hypothetical protein [Caudoviricetes sp.]